MTLQNAPDTRPASTGRNTLKEESARYALLRRIAPALRHHMAGTLQPIGMISAIMERRLQAAEPDLTALRDSSKSIGTLSRSAASAGMNLITWVVPKENGVVSLQAGVEECVGLLATDLAFRGFTLVNNIGPSDALTSVGALRTVFTAALITLTDSARSPASVVLSSEPDHDQTWVRITVNCKDGATGSDDPQSYRKLGWDDVNVLAAAEQVRLSHGADRVEMRFSAAEHANIPP